MKWLWTLCLLTGCGPVIDAELRLIDQSRRGVELVRGSIEQRREVAVASEANDRKRLDDAFDADVTAHVDDLNTEWVLEARRAYAAAVESLARRDAAAAKSVEVDLQNLDSINAALDELQRLNESQKTFYSNLEKR